VKSSAPAKINLSLRILHKRADGFHELQTLMVPLSLADELEIERSDGEQVDFHCDDPSLPRDESNLVVKALLLFARQSATPAGYRVALTKRIPAGAGLGGGSSDAAAALQLANALHRHPLTPDNLRDLAARLGSDVPFFLQPTPQLCSGRGEVSRPFTGTLPQRVLLVKPPFEISTPWAYRTYAAMKEAGRLPAADGFSWKSISLQNDLEPAVFQKYVALQVLKEWLTEQDETHAALMSGSGSTVFAILRSNIDEPALREKVHEAFGSTFWSSVAEVAQP
jgi:4-diphosphocytidyl-2-C-methyl-D-erythritol kinase